MKTKTTGLSLKELYEANKDLFWSKNPWWRNELFADVKPEAGNYEFVFDKKTKNKTFTDQKKMIERDFMVPHVAQVIEALINHYKKTGEKLLSDFYVRTNTLVSDGNRVIVGHFDSDGLRVDRYWDDDRNDLVGLSAARKLEPGTLESLDSLENLILQSAIELVKKGGYKVIREY